MANAVSFAVNDTSPTISYFPFADTLSTPNLSAGWNPYYTMSGFVSVLGDVGDGTSLHITSDNGSSLLIQWHGTGIQLYGNATFASFSISLDDGPPFTPAATSDNNVLLTMTDLADTPHAVTLTALIPTSEEQNPPNSSLVVFESAVLTSSPAPLNVSFSSQTIDDNGIAFLGRWSFDTAPTGASFHSSQTQGDHAVASFNGTTFLLHGITSPDSGNYTVTVDNVTTTLSAQSSFTAYDSLLFYATGLDLSTHYVQVSNSGGGNLSLLVGGFNSFAPFSTLPSPPVQTSSSSVVERGFSKGTIAAFVLAGILAFLIFSSLIFYFFFYRPRRRLRGVLAERKNRTPKEREAGVIEIGPEVDKTVQVNTPIEPDQGNGGYGFSRWKRGAVEGSPGELSLPIRFQRSDSVDEKFASPTNEVPLDDLSDLSTNSSAKRIAQAKSKGKARQITGRSYSPGRILPFNRARRVQHVSTNTAESLDVSTFIAAEPPSAKNVAPPSYAASVSIRDSKSTTNGNPVTKSSSNRSMPSVPHSVSPFPDDQDHPPQKQDQTGAILLPQEELSYEQGSSEDSSQNRLKPPQPTPMNSLTRIDQGSEVGDNDTLPASLQQAIRNISPRPFRHPYANQDEDSIHTPSPQNASFLEDPVLTLLPELPSNNDDLVEVRDGVFLSVGPASPFQVTFDPKPHTSNKSNSGGLSYTSTPSDSKTNDGSSGHPNPDDGMGPASSDFVQGPSNTRFRLTPLSIPPTLAVDPPSNSAKDSEGVMSFLDFSSSREGSLASRSAWSEERQRVLDPPVEEKSRWSNTTVPSMKSKSSQFGNNSNASGNGSSDGSNKLSEPRSVQSTIPIRVSIPSYDNSMVSAQRSRTSGLTTGDTLHVHPPFESLESPTESMSIPMSAVSELHFRQSVSEENVGFNSRRTTESSLVFVSSSHPPLPTRHDENTPRPFDPSILVNRVLGLTPTSTNTRTTTTTTTTTTTATAAAAAAAAYPSPPVSSLSPFASPHASRFITNIRGDRVDSQNSGTDSLEP